MVSCKPDVDPMFHVAAICKLELDHGLLPCKSDVAPGNGSVLHRLCHSIFYHITVGAASSGVSAVNTGTMVSTSSESDFSSSGSEYIPSASEGSGTKSGQQESSKNQGRKRVRRDPMET